VIFTQFVDDALGCASYLVGDPDTGEAALVDPSFAIEQYLEEADRRGITIVRVIETHTHADHLSGHGRLALEHGIPITIHRLAGAKYPHDPMEDGDEIVLGKPVGGDLREGKMTLAVIHLLHRDARAANLIRKIVSEHASTIDECELPRKSTDTSSSSVTSRTPFMGPAAAFLRAALMSSALVALPSSTVRSTSDTFGVGTRMATPSSLPLSSGMAR